MRSLITRTVPVPADRVWAAVAAVGRLDVWFPSISACRVEGEGVGARRLLTIEGIGEAIDVVREIDPDARRLVYERVESPFPVTSYLGTVDVAPVDDERTVVTWSVDFAPLPDMGELVDALLVDGIGAGLAGLETDLVAP